MFFKVGFGASHLPLSTSLSFPCADCLKVISPSPPLDRNCPFERVSGGGDAGVALEGLDAL